MKPRTRRFRGNVADVAPEADTRGQIIQFGGAPSSEPMFLMAGDPLSTGRPVPTAAAYWNTF